MYRHRGFNHFNPSSLFNIYCRYYRTRQNYESYSSRNSFFYTRGICVWVTCKTLYSNVHLSSWLFTGYKIINILQATSRGVYIMFLACWSVSPQFCFYVSTTFLKPLDRILWNCVVIKRIMCSCAYFQGILISLFVWKFFPLLTWNFVYYWLLF